MSYTQLIPEIDETRAKVLRQTKSVMEVNTKATNKDRTELICTVNEATGAEDDNLVFKDLFLGTVDNDKISEVLQATAARYKADFILRR